MQYLNEIQLKIGKYGQDTFKDADSIILCDKLINFNNLPVPFIPWHWHDSVELFYVESGYFEFTTIHGTQVFPTGSGGFINSGVIHKIKWADIENHNILRLFKFNISSVMDMSHDDVKNLLGSSVEIIPFSSDDTHYLFVLNKMKEYSTIFSLNRRKDLNIRNFLTEIMEAIFKAGTPFVPMNKIGFRTNTKLKMMMSYVHQHYCKAFPMSRIAEQGQLSSYSCHRFFRDKLSTTPVDYTNEVRLYFACLLLVETNEYVENIASCCGFCTSSYFGKLFKEKFRCTPMEYRLAKQSIKISN